VSSDSLSIVNTDPRRNRHEEPSYINIISALALAGSVLAGMQGQGAQPDAPKPEYKEENPGGYRTSDIADYIQEHYMSLDINGDGCLSREELSADQSST
jgi:hypothetical protein